MSISTEISRIQTATADIKTAITGKGVTVPEGSQIDDLPALITSIPAGSGGGGGGDLDALIQRTITEIHSGVTSIGGYAFYQCHALTTADFPSVTSIGMSAFRNCYALTTTNFPLATSISDYVFQNCSALTTTNFPSVTSIGNGVFRNCTQLSTLILRENAVCALANMNALAGTSISSGTGYIYVPASLVDAYKAATNWVTYANQIRAIENYPEITGG